MFRPSCHLLLPMILFSLCSGGTLPADAASLRCTESPINFTYDGNEKLNGLCATANAALDFLVSIGLETHDCITIQLLDDVTSGRDHTLIGKYDPVSREVSLLTYDKAVELADSKKLMPGTRLSEELWCSYAAHELAHVVSCQHLAPHIKAHTAGEYISAVTQLTVLSQPARDEFLARYGDVDAYQTRDEMSELYFLLDPNRFAVKCYLHFMSLENPRTFIDQLIRKGNGF